MKHINTAKEPNKQKWPLCHKVNVLLVTEMQVTAYIGWKVRWMSVGYCLCVICDRQAALRAIASNIKDSLLVIECCSAPNNHALNGNQVYLSRTKFFEKVPT